MTESFATRVKLPKYSLSSSQTYTPIRQARGNANFWESQVCNQDKSSIDSYQIMKAKNSPRTPNKFNYKYERVNNSFRLVQVECEDDQEENKQNLVKQGQSNQKYHQILMTVNSLTERVEKLQKSQKFEDHRQEFQIHKMIEKVIAEHKHLDYERNNLTFKKLEESMQEVQKLKKKLQEMNKSQVSNSSPISLKRCYQLQKNHFKVSDKENCGNDASVMKKINESLNVLKMEMESKFEELWKVVKENESKVPLKKLTIKSAPIFSILVSLTLKKVLSDDSLQQQGESYGIDPQGHLLDHQGFYLLDSIGNMITLDGEQMKKLSQYGIISDGQ